MSRTLFKIEIGQFWRKGGQTWHVPRQERVPPHPKAIQVIRCERSGIGKMMLWVYPRTPADQPFWNLRDFEDAELMEGIR